MFSIRIRFVEIKIRDSSFKKLNKRFRGKALEKRWSDLRINEWKLVEIKPDTIFGRKRKITIRKDKNFRIRPIKNKRPNPRKLKIIWQRNTRHPNQIIGINFTKIINSRSQLTLINFVDEK